MFYWLAERQVDGRGGEGAAMQWVGALYREMYVS